MRKKFITFLLAFTLTSSILLTACGSAKTDSSGNKTETETQAPEADDQQILNHRKCKKQEIIQPSSQ